MLQGVLPKVDRLCAITEVWFFSTSTGKMMFKGLTSIILVGLLLMVSGDRECSWSRKTVQKVDSCPVNKSTYEQRRKDKNCQAIAELQQCTTPSKFSYHCLINEYSDALIEVCAPIFIINGYCAEYNIIGARIQPHYNLKCSDINPPCGDRYNSTDAYLYTGCYEIVKKNQLKTNVNTNNVFTTELSTTVGEIPVKESSSLETQPALIAVIVTVVFVAVVITVLILVIRRRGYPCQIVLDGNDTECLGEEEHLLSIVGQPNHSGSMTDGNCDGSHYEKFIQRGKALRDNLLANDDTIEDKREKIKDETVEYLKSYEHLNNHFVVTSLTKECSDKLSTYGVVVIIGEQGSGKTSTAVHLMNSKPYDQWSRCKITTWSDLLILEFQKNTLIYIDNAFDGFIYHQELHKWWQSLCYFYFKCLNQRRNVRIMISAKHKMIEKACEFVKADIKFIKKNCFVRTDSFPLSREEKSEIIEKQIELAKTVQKTGDFSVTEELMDEIENKKKWAIGFPFCAHLYAFEKNYNSQDFSIFQNPRSHVRKQIEKMIEEDKTKSNIEDEDKTKCSTEGRKPNGTKTLFLILMYQFSPGKTDQSKQPLDLRYATSCKEFFEENCPKDLGKEIRLSFENLYERAKKMEGDVLIKHQSMYEFKHQVYLEEVRNYFFRTHFSVVVEHFPLSILRTYKMDRINEDVIDRLSKRLQKEINQGAISEALSCYIFKESRFTKTFCQSLKEDKSLMTKLLSFADKSSNFSFPIIFWASKYSIPKLSHVILDFADKQNESDNLLQFCLALLGECCAKDESYITQSEFPFKMEDIQKLVLRFKTAGGTISDMMPSFGKSDDASYILNAVRAKSMEEQILANGKSLLHYIIDKSKV